MYLMREPAPIPAYLRPPSREVVDELAMLIERIQLRQTVFMQHWRSLCTASDDTPVIQPERLLEETYVPRLRSAIACLARGDTAGFFTSGRALGAELADAGVPFAAMVTHASFLKDGCAMTLADDPVAVAPALLVLERPVAWLVAAAADGYYRRPQQEPVDEPGDAELFALSDDPRNASATVPLFHGMVGRSGAMQRVFAQIMRTAASSAPVLILGETGTGKELAARAIHHAGPRRAGPFIALNCAALPRDLIESELFGHKRGAFSGAIADCVGLVRAAAGGTLLLDEITEMGPELQAKFLRVLQDHAVRPVGSVIEEPVDVRVIASSNRDPEAALRSGVLRADLYYRLRGSTLVMPSLDTRRDDIPDLVEHHLSVLNRQYGGPAPKVRGITARALRALRTAPWPGNVRELQYVVENAFTMCGSIIRLENLDFASSVPELGPAEVCARLPTFHENERTLIERVLRVTRGNKVRAARELGISRKALYARMARYGLTLLAFRMLAVR
jgi:DNA-binding NtrC family response regulator